MLLTIPAGSFRTVQDDEALRRARQELKERLLRGESVTVGDGGELRPDNPPEQPLENKPQIVIPPGKLAASFYWYESEPELYEAEIAMMTSAKSPFRHFKLDKLQDGRLYWSGQVVPGMLSGGRRTYTLWAVYDHNHPNNDSYGGSIKVYMVDPDLDELRQKVPIPHLLSDSSGSVYLCTARSEDFRTGKLGSTSACSALGWAVKWLSFFELYLSDEITYNQFAAHV